MRNLRRYYSATIAEFLRQSDSEILGVIHQNDISAETAIQQNNAWSDEVRILKDQLRNFSEGRVIFEYTIPRMGKRVDAVVLHRNIVFLLEFKVGDTEYRASTYDQVYDYALDLRNFQRDSHDKLLVPIMISTKAPRYQNKLTVRDRIIEPLRCNAENIGAAIEYIDARFSEPAFDYEAREDSEYLPTPTIVEAAQALYRGHNVHDITRSDAGAENLTATTGDISDIIEYSKANGRKSICFVTGVPGAGKTLVGLNIAIERSDAQKGVSDFDYSEPEFLISTMDRHDDWAVIICLVGGGQEINTGEAGLPEWFDSLRKAFSHWDVYITPQLNDEEYRRDREWNEMIGGLRVFEREKLHLATSVRSFRTPDLAAFVKAGLDADTENAKALCEKIKDKYPVVLTRDLSKAKAWVQDKCQGTTRYGLLASSGALRLKPEGVFVKNEINVANWFLNGKDDVRSSYALEDVVTEFDIQGLELDYSIVGWDADYRFDGEKWTYNSFVGNSWNNVGSEERRLYLKNTYRVLLTRARQGMAIFIPEGSDTDHTRKREYYDRTYEYLCAVGVEELN